MLNNIRARFIRGQEVKFISHLDLMKVFERAIRRADIPIAYSQGFNPHPQMIFGLPLSVGVTSEAEYADFELSNTIKLEDFIEGLNRQLPKGLTIKDAKYFNTRANIMKAISFASYNVLVSYDDNVGINIIKNKIEELMSKNSITVMKEGKKGIRDVDIRPMIFELEASEPGNEEFVVPEKCSVSRFSMLLSAGSAANLKPELLVSAINEVADINLKTMKIHRTGLFVSKEGKRLNPLDDAALLEA